MFLSLASMLYFPHTCWADCCHKQCTIAWHGYPQLDDMFRDNPVPKDAEFLAGALLCLLQQADYMLLSFACLLHCHTHAEQTVVISSAPLLDKAISIACQCEGNCWLQGKVIEWPLVGMSAKHLTNPRFTYEYCTQRLSIKGVEVIEVVVMHGMHLWIC